MVKGNKKGKREKMSQTKVQTKEGAAAIYTVVFFCLLIGIVTIGFVSIMIQDIIGSTNYDLSQSAYDAALAGVEDAKVLLLQYNTCMSNESRLSNNKCEKIINDINTSGSSDDCDLVRDALGRASGEDGANETLVQTINDPTNPYYGKAKGLSDNIDMAYTCVKLSLASDDYLGTLTETSDMKIIPLRTGVGSAYNDAGSDGNFNRIRISWFSQDDNTTVRDLANYTTLYVPTIPNSKYPTSKTTPSDLTSDAYSFSEKATLPPIIKVGLIQTDGSFMFRDFDESVISGSSVRTNRGAIFLRPVSSTVETPSATHIANNTGTGFGGSVLSHSTNYLSGINPVNSPIDVACQNTDQMAGDNGMQYACTAEIDVPATVRNSVNNSTRFLTVSSLYAKPDTSFSVQLLNCKADGTCSIVKFVGVQSKVDATGRANDLFRRIEARVELQDVSYPFVKYGLSTYGQGGDDGEIFKNYWATSNCWYKDKGESKSCNDYQRASDSGNF